MKTAKQSTLSATLTPEVKSFHYTGSSWHEAPTAIPLEASLAVSVNGRHFLNLLCTPLRMEALVAGFLYSEGMIESPQDIITLKVDTERMAAAVVVREGSGKPGTLIRTPSGIAFEKITRPVTSSLRIAPAQVISLMGALESRQALYQKGGGIHCSALARPENIVVIAEDIGRHNTIDKVLGEFLLKDELPEDHVLMTTGRISSEMLLKGVRMGTPVIMSRGAPTERAVRLGDELGITVIGFTRGDSFIVFTGEDKIIATK